MNQLRDVPADRLDVRKMHQPPAQFILYTAYYLRMADLYKKVHALHTVMQTDDHGRE